MIRLSFLRTWAKPTLYRKFPYLCLGICLALIEDTTLIPYKYHNMGRVLSSFTSTYIPNSPTFSIHLVEIATKDFKENQLLQ